MQREQTSRCAYYDCVFINRGLEGFNHCLCITFSRRLCGQAGNRVHTDPFITIIISTTVLFVGAVALTNCFFTARCGCSRVSPAAFNTTVELAAEKFLDHANH